MNASIADGVLIFVAGVLISLVAFRVIPMPRNNPTAVETVERWGRFMRISGPLISLWGGYMIGQALR
jgi:hypothetical protein